MSVLIGCGNSGVSPAADSDRPTTEPNGADRDAGNTDILFELIGFSTPESALYDQEGDLYLVSNINGTAGAVDDNGFISRVSPEGVILEAKWIDGADAAVVLNAPKGMGIFQDTLFIADITAVRKFHRITGAHVGDIEIDGAVFLNDITVDAEGRTYVSDSSGGIVYRIETDDTYRAFTKGNPLPSPNGLAARGDDLWIATDTEILRLDKNAEVVSTTAVPTGFLDGLVVLADGRLIVSSWDGECVYISTTPDSAFVQLFSNLSGAADIGFDTFRSRVLIPMLTEDTLQIRLLK